MPIPAAESWDDGRAMMDLGLENEVTAWYSMAIASDSRSKRVDIVGIVLFSAIGSAVVQIQLRRTRMRGERRK
jgi:hypothetical protein